MYRQLLKLLFAINLLLTITTKSLAQFPYVVLPGEKPKGKVDSIVTLSGLGKNVAAYNKQGQLIKIYQTPFMEQSTYGDLVRDTMIIYYRYDDRGNLSESTHYYRGKTNYKFLRNYEYVHSDTGVVIKTLNMNVPQEIQMDRAGKVILTKGHLVPGLSDDTRYSYNKKGYVIEKREIPPAPYPSRSTFYKYNADGNLKQVTRIRGQLIKKYRYPKYDKMHNWLIQYGYWDGDLVDSVVRCITYHK